jgi:hypothetical protein
MEGIIDEAYNLFKGDKAQTPLDICTDCCMDMKDEQLLADLPVKDIPKNLLMEYNDGAATEKTPISELKHFLPRYLELIWHLDFPSHSTELSLKRLEPFEDDEWSKDEADFLNTFASAFFMKCLSVHPLPESETIDSILIMLWKGQFELSELLKSWELNRSVSSTLHFKDLYFQGFKLHHPSKMSNSFGDDELSVILRKWIETKSVQVTFKENIERIIIEEFELDELELDQLNVLYEILNRSDNI